MSTDNSCCLCSQILGDFQNDLISRSIREDIYTRRVPLESELFAVIPSVGPLARGHSLLCPRAHVRSIANLPPEAGIEYAAMRSRLRQIIGRVFKAPVHCFEHGSAATSSKIVCTVDHAHLHFLPANVDVLRSLLETGGWVEIGTDLRALSDAVSGCEYLYYETPEGRAFICTNDQAEFESQYLRRLFAMVLNRPGTWDWRQDLRIDEVEQTYQELRAATQESQAATGSAIF
jgi:ATP adenylyltransferase